LFSLLGEGWVVDHDDRGRPVVVDAKGRRGPDVSLSHTGGLAVAAVTTVGRIGVDIEMPKAERSVAAIAALVLSVPEQALVAADGEAALLACWTLREAAGKAIGSGLAGGLAIPGEVIRTALQQPTIMAFEDCVLALAQRPLCAGSLAVAWLVPAWVPAPAQVLAAACVGIEIAPTE
jgi:phosphopantetheinyl transferase